MDFTKWTPKLRYIILTLFIGTIIGHLVKNHIESSTKPAFQQTLALPKESATIQQKPIAVAAPPPAPTQLPVTKTIEFKTSIIHHSLGQAAHDAGLTADMTRQLDAMFASQYRSREIHPGDRLEVLYHEYFVGDQKDHPGHIVAAKIIDSHHKDLSMVRFTTSNNQSNYYTPSGESTKPSYLTTPVHYNRIASGFSYSRFDPVIHKVHPHLGVDLDAPTGTPVKAIGDGIVLFCHQMHGYGNVVMIQYNNTYKTLYAHLEKFAGHMHPHEHVTKGEVVGYVGTTGWTTGPHLHYSLYKNGKAVNPLTIHFPNTSLPERYRQAFFYKENHRLSEMKLFEDAMLASNENNTNTVKKAVTTKTVTHAKSKHYVTHHHYAKNRKKHYVIRHHRKKHLAKLKRHHIVHHHKEYA